MCVCVCPRMSLCVCTCMSLCVCTCISLCVCAHASLCVCVCTCIFMCVGQRRGAEVMTEVGNRGDEERWRPLSAKYRTGIRGMCVWGVKVG